MKNSQIIYKAILFFSFLVWLINGLFFKLLNFMPRHEQIVAAILGNTYSNELVFMIGIGELFIAVWILTSFKSKLCVWIQIGLVLTMNLLEFALVPEMLMFGRLNLLIALLFSSILYFNEFKLKNG